MPTPRKDLRQVIARLEEQYGGPEPPPATDPLEMILWENVAYLVDDARRLKAFRALKRRIGTRPHDILAAPAEKLHEVARLGGMRPEARVEKLRGIAALVLGEFEGDLDGVLDTAPPAAKRALKKFPGIGDPGAEKILLFSRRLPVLALESNGQRVLLRIGFGAEKKSYAATYRSVQEAIADQTPADYAWLVAAHQLLRRHGQDLCRRFEPRCEACPVSGSCAYFDERAR